jgi:hypothetical protein
MEETEVGQIEALKKPRPWSSRQIEQLHLHQLRHETEASLG